MPDTNPERLLQQSEGLTTTLQSDGSITTQQSEGSITTQQSKGSITSQESEKFDYQSATKSRPLSKYAK